MITCDVSHFIHQTHPAFTSLDLIDLQYFSFLNTLLCCGMLYCQSELRNDLFTKPLERPYFPLSVLRFFIFSIFCSEGLTSYFVEFLVSVNSGT